MVGRCNFRNRAWNIHRSGIDATLNRSLLALLVLASCYGNPQPNSDAGEDAGIPGDYVGLVLDGKRLNSGTSGDTQAIVLEEGTHTLTAQGSKSFTIKNDIQGSGQLRVELPSDATLYIEGTLSHGGFIVANGTVDMTRAVDRSGESSVLDGGVLKRLATPNDISFTTKIWLDSDRIFTLFSDTDGKKPLKIPNRQVKSWRSLDREVQRLTVANIPGGQYLGAGEGIKFVDTLHRLGVLSIYTSEYTYAMVVRPIAMVPNTDPCFLTTNLYPIGNPPFAYEVGASVCVNTNASGTKSLLKFANSMHSWATVTAPWFDLEARDNTAKRYFINDGGVDVIMTAYGDGTGQGLQVNSTLIVANPERYSDDIWLLSNFGRYRNYKIGANTYETTFIDLVLKELVITSDMKSADALTGYLAWRHGMQAKLRENHPYKLGPPTAVVDAGGTTVYRPCVPGPLCKVSFRPSCAPFCPFENSCEVADQCSSKVCSSSKCAAPSCAPNCKGNEKCGANADCISGKCLRGVCDVPLCSPSCSTGDPCGATTDCRSNQCVNNKCI